MDIKDILSVGLTAEDFDTMIKGIDAITEAKKASEMLVAVQKSMLDVLLKNYSPQQTERDMQRRMKEIEANAAAAQDDLIILKSRLIQLKRLLAGNEAMRMAKEILSSSQQK